jgi:hypothetical protein
MRIPLALPNPFFCSPSSAVGYINSPTSTPRCNSKPSISKRVVQEVDAMRISRKKGGLGKRRGYVPRRSLQLSPHTPRRQRKRKGEDEEVSLEEDRKGKRQGWCWYCQAPTMFTEHLSSSILLTISLSLGDLGFASMPRMALILVLSGFPCIP